MATHSVATELARGPWDPRRAARRRAGGAAGARVRALLARAGPAARAGHLRVRAPGAARPLLVSRRGGAPGPARELLEALDRATATGSRWSARGRCASRAERARRRAGVRRRRRSRARARTRRTTSAPPDGRCSPPTRSRSASSQGAFREPGPATAWFRLRVPLVAGEQPSPLQRLAAAGDFGNGIATELDWDEHIFINPDLTLYIEREPVGEWVALQSRDAGRRRAASAIAESVLWDDRGPDRAARSRRCSSTRRGAGPAAATSGGRP